jgi:uncharacterized membrane protein YeaQ/YmgE (transglycosylase-associated protein family)
MLITFWLLAVAINQPNCARAESVGQKVESATESAKQAVTDAGKSATSTIEELWRSISEARLKNRTGDEIVAWIIMGLLVGGLLNRVTGLKTFTAFGLGLVGAFIGGVVAHVTKLNFGLGPVMIRYEDLLLSFVGGLLLLLVGKILMRGKKKSS